MHVFKYLDTMAMKEEKTRNGTFDGNTTLRRKAAATHSSGPLTELQKIRRQNVDSGYSTSDGYDKRWSQELPSTTNGTPIAATTVTDNGNASKWSPTQIQSVLSTEKQSPGATSYSQFQPQSSGNSTPTLSSPAGSNNNTLTSNQSNISDYVKPTDLVDNTTPKRSLNGNNRFVSKQNNYSRFHFHAAAQIHLPFCFIFITIIFIINHNHEFFLHIFIYFHLFIYHFIWFIF